MTAVRDDRVLAQRFDALNAANSSRIRKARLREQIATGQLAPALVVRDPPFFMQSERVADFLACCPGVGPLKIRRLNVRAAHQPAPVNLLAPMGALSERQRDWLISQLPTLLGRKGTC